MMRPWMAVATVAVGFLFAGCSQGASPANDPPRERVGAVSVRETSGEPAAPPSSVAEPPDSALGSGDRDVTGELGSYCWSSGSGGSCVDAVYPLVPGKEKTLAVPAGSDMVFDYGGEEPPGAVRAGSEPLGPGGKPTGSSPRSLKTGGSGGRVTIPAELPAGDYVVDVSVTVPEGSASYYFRVAVGRDDASLPATGEPSPAPSSRRTSE